jgi:hypothetical protein
VGKGKALKPNWKKIDSTKVRIDSIVKEIHLETIEKKYDNKCRKCRNTTEVCSTCNQCYNPECNNFGCPWCADKRKEIGIYLRNK